MTIVDLMTYFSPSGLFTICTVLFFLVALTTEFLFAKLLRKSVYAGRDSLTNLTLYFGSLIIDFMWVPVVFYIYSAVHAYSLTKFGYQWWLFQGTTPLWHWGLLIIADDFCYYWFHRTSHKVWFLWASHENHHSSNHFNLTVAARQTWTPFFTFVFWLPLAWIGFDPLMILTMQLLSLLFQSLLHTELIRGFGPLELIFNSPRHHRAHHGTNSQYLDRNFGGIFIIWDRLFGTFQNEGERVIYGTGEAPGGYHPIRAVSGEYRRLFKTFSKSKGFQKLKVPFMPPGWRSDA
jgi:sterol desaturase/sphingolipid hydroxylase (fatty acid hydroxylase superfamily)